ncbi:uncharacterized protein LOC110095418 [Dendrobium catenatum]|uniref:uncharacterized protein LOC110095418 n=1 Tax=Dendrobium catenatum TaxID=906689 RepID=UPI00109FC18B|nr:uncharacterized protein LOC110095418 [Dendrobium catenatum]
MEVPPLLIHLHNYLPATSEESWTASWRPMETRDNQRHPHRRRTQIIPYSTSRFRQELDIDWFPEHPEALNRSAISVHSADRPEHSLLSSLAVLPTPTSIKAPSMLTRMFMNKFKVLSCLRFIIRKVSKEKLAVEELQRLFPVDLSTDIQKTLVTLLQKYQSQWEKEVASEQPLSQQTRMTFPGRLNAPPAYIPLQVSNLSSWPREENTRSYPYGVNNACTIPSFSDLNLLHKSSMVALRDNGSSDNPATLHRLKSMTWSMELRNSIPGNRLSVITLKLQDYAKSHLGEVEVKFQLSRDTLEAMLRSLTYINDQLSDSHTSSNFSCALSRCATLFVLIIYTNFI